ncbi:MAG: OsmC family protein [Planctomycetota bacterium]
MVQINVNYLGDLRTEAVHGPSAARLLTDAPRDNQGQGASFSPTDLLATALGTCMLTIMGIVARRHAWSLAGAKVSVEKIMMNEPVRRVARLVLQFDLPAALAPEARKTLEGAALSCPVHKSLHPDIALESTFRYVV